MAGNSDVNFPPRQPWDALGWTPRSDRQAGRRPDDRKGEGRTFANPLGLRRGLPGWCPRQRRPRPPACADGAGGPSGPPAPALATLRGWSARRCSSRPSFAAAARGSAAKDGRSPLGSPLPWGMGARHTHAICVASGNAPCSAACGRLAGSSAAERRADHGLREGEKDARRWAVPCHGHGMGRRPAWGASCGLKPCPRSAAGRLDPACAPRRPLGSVDPCSFAWLIKVSARQRKLSARRFTDSVIS